MLSPADLLNLIRLAELELDQIHRELKSEDDHARDEAGEMSIQMEKLAEKLKDMYIKMRPSDSELPTYEEYIDILQKAKS